MMAANTVWFGYEDVAASLFMLENHTLDNLSSLLLKPGCSRGGDRGKEMGDRREVPLYYLSICVHATQEHEIILTIFSKP
jgi:hypothetical protein